MLFLLAPQVKFKFNATRDKYEPIGIPVEVINLEDYGMLMGTYLKRAIQLIKIKNRRNCYVCFVRKK